jgi:hypothetical protein
MLHRILCAAAAAAAVACCQPAWREPGTAVTTGASASAAETAAQTLAVARCDREEKCNNVGDGKEFTSLNACVDELRDKSKNDLRTAACRGGVDDAQLDKCVAEIRGERCGNALDTITRLTSCRSSALCVQ